MQLKNDNPKIQKILISRVPCEDCDHKHYIIKMKGSAKLKDNGCTSPGCDCGKNRKDDDD